MQRYRKNLPVPLSINVFDYRYIDLYLDLKVLIRFEHPAQTGNFSACPELPFAKGKTTPKLAHFVADSGPINKFLDLGFQKKKP